MKTRVQFSPNDIGICFCKFLEGTIVNLIWEN